MKRRESKDDPFASLNFQIMDVSAILPKDIIPTDMNPNIISVNLDEDEALSGRGSSSK